MDVALVSNLVALIWFFLHRCCSTSYQEHYTCIHIGDVLVASKAVTGSAYSSLKSDAIPLWILLMGANLVWLNDSAYFLPTPPHQETIASQRRTNEIQYKYIRMFGSNSSSWTLPKIRALTACPKSTCTWATCPSPIVQALQDLQRKADRDQDRAELLTVPYWKITCIYMYILVSVIQKAGLSNSTPLLDKHTPLFDTCTPSTALAYHVISYISPKRCMWYLKYYFQLDIVELKEIISKAIPHHESLSSIRKTYIYIMLAVGISDPSWLSLFSSLLTYLGR